MPTFIQKNPKELSGDYKINKKISSRLMSANAVSGFIGTSKKDTDNYNNLIKLIEELETQQELFLSKVAFWELDPETQNGPNTTFLFIAIKKILNLISKKTFSLYDLPSSDIDKINEYVDTMNKYIEQYTNIRDRVNLYANQRGVINVESITQELTNINDIIVKLQELVDLLQTKMLTYKSAFIDPPEKLVMTHEELVGGCSCEYKGNPMYQTRKYLSI